MTMVSDTPGVSPAQLKADLRECLSAPLRYYRPLMLTGIPGVGKTAVVEQVCSELGIPCWILRPAQHESVEFTGLPCVNGDGKAHWVPFTDLLPTDPTWEGVIFSDETTQLDTSGQKIVASLLDKAGVAGARIPKGARFILAGNRQQDRAGAGRLISIIESRCRQAELLFSLSDWQHWAMSAGIHETVISFSDFKASQFVAFDPARSLNPLPRTWHAVSDELFSHPNAGTAKDDSVMLAAVRGWVGSGMAAEFMAFREHFHLLHNVVDDVFDNPATASFGTSDPSVQHALVGAVAQRLKERLSSITDQQLANIVLFAKRCLPAKSLQALLCLRCTAADPKRFVKVNRPWLVENKDIIAAWNKSIV